MKSCLDRMKDFLPKHNVGSKPFTPTNKTVFPYFLSYESFIEERGGNPFRSRGIPHYKPLSHMGALTHPSSVTKRTTDCDWVHPNFVDGVYMCSAGAGSNVGSSNAGAGALTLELLKFANYVSPNDAEQLTRHLLQEDLRELVTCRYDNLSAVSSPRESVNSGSDDSDDGSSSSSGSGGDTDTGNGSDSPKPAVGLHFFGSQILGLGIFSSDIDVSISGLLDEGRTKGQIIAQDSEVLASKFMSSMDRLVKKQQIRDREEQEASIQSDAAAAARARVFALLKAHGRLPAAYADSNCGVVDVANSASTSAGAVNEDNEDGDIVGDGWAIDTVPDTDPATQTQTQMAPTPAVDRKRKASEALSPYAEPFVPMTTATNPNPNTVTSSDDADCNENSDDSDSEFGGQQSDSDDDDDIHLDLNLNGANRDGYGDGNRSANSSSSHTIGGAWSSYSTKSIRNQQFALWNAQSNKNQQIQNSGGDQNTLERRKELILNHLRKVLTSLRQMEYVQWYEFISKARVPIINCMHVNGVECDVSVGISANDTTDVIKAMVLTVYNYAHGTRVMLSTDDTITLQREIVVTIRHLYYPLVCFLKVFLSLTGMNKPFSGGLGAFKVYVMVTKILLGCRTQELRFDNTSCNGKSSSNDSNQYANPVDTGSILLRFLEYYGNPSNLNTQTEISLDLNCISAGADSSNKVETEFRAQFKVDYCCFLFRITSQTLTAMLQHNALVNSKYTRHSYWRGEQRQDSLLGCVLDVKTLTIQRNKSILKAEIYNRTRFGSCDNTKQYLAAFMDGSGDGARQYSARKDIVANAILASAYRQVVRSYAESGRKNNSFCIFDKLTIDDVRAVDIGLYSRLHGCLSATGAASVVTSSRTMPVSLTAPMRSNGSDSATGPPTKMARVGELGDNNRSSESRVKRKADTANLDSDDGDSDNDSYGGCDSIGDSHDTGFDNYNSDADDDSDSDADGEGVELLHFAQMRYRQQQANAFTGNDSNGNKASTSAGTGGKVKPKRREPPRKRQRSVNSEQDHSEIGYFGPLHDIDSEEASRLLGDPAQGKMSPRISPMQLKQQEERRAKLRAWEAKRAATQVQAPLQTPAVVPTPAGTDSKSTKAAAKKEMDQKAEANRVKKEAARKLHVQQVEASRLKKEMKIRANMAANHHIGLQNTKGKKQVMTHARTAAKALDPVFIKIPPGATVGLAIKQYEQQKRLSQGQGKGGKAGGRPTNAQAKINFQNQKYGKS